MLNEIPHSSWGSLSHEDVVDLNELLHEALRVMSSTVRAIFEAVVIGGRPETAVAQDLGCCRNTVHARLVEALTILRELGGHTVGSENHQK